jgi:pectinesterase
MPPMLFVNSSLPRYHVGRDAAVDTMKRYGIYHEIHTIPGTPHPFWLFKPWQAEVVKHVVDFLDRVFKE